MKDATSELTFRGICLGAVITVVFMSANVYLGLKTGITFSSSVPAAIISMGVLKLVGGGDILENNIVQTQASAAGTLCNINLVIPGLVLIDFWHGFPLWQTMAVCLLGGLSGVAFSVPLRRLMVVDSELPFPEGVAAAEVLSSGHSHGSDDGGLRQLGLGAAAASVFGFLTTGLRLLPDQLTATFVAGGSIFRLGGGLSLALVGIGYLVRLGCCLALLIGIFIAWAIAVPILSNGHPLDGDPAAAAQALWTDKVRLIGAGLIAVAGLWTVASLIKPMIDRLTSNQEARGRIDADRAAHDIPLPWVGVAIAALAIPTGALFWVFLSEAKLQGSLLILVPALTTLTLLFGFLMAMACGYLAGLLGSSSSPISGIGILTAMLVAGCGLALLPNSITTDARLVAALTLFVTTFIITASSIANDNLQDLKAGQIVGATPWKQQAALAIGVCLGAITVAPVLELLYTAYGFTGSLPRPGMDVHNAMPAPQASLSTQITNGIVHHQLDWTMVSIGGALGAGFVALESVLLRRGFSLPALSVGIGMYLPCPVVMTIAIGGLIGWVSERRIASSSSAENDQKALRRRGVLLSSGFLVGESLVGIAIAMADISSGRSGMLALGQGSYALILDALAVLLFVAMLGVFYRSISSRSIPAT